MCVCVNCLFAIADRVIHFNTLLKYIWRSARPVDGNRKLRIKLESHQRMHWIAMPSVEPMGMSLLLTTYTAEPSIRPTARQFHSKTMQPCVCWFAFILSSFPIQLSAAHILFSCCLCPSCAAAAAIILCILTRCVARLRPYGFNLHFHNDTNLLWFHSLNAATVTE